jgi:uncharacterized iron-regulated membrane protein
MKDYFRQSMAWLHTWVGLLLGWVLYFMFITGTAGYLDTEIDRWMNPELPVSQFSAPAAQVAHASHTFLNTHAPNAEHWFISLPLNRNDPYPRVFWDGAKGEGIEASGNHMLDPMNGTVLTGRDTAGGQTLYRMHWKLHYLPEIMSDWLIGIATMFMFIALITGVIRAQEDIRQFFHLPPRQWSALLAGCA